MQKNWYRLLAVSLLSCSLVAGCSTMDEDSTEAVDSTYAPLAEAPEGKAIPGHYVIVFKDDAAASAVSAAMNRVALAGDDSQVQRSYSIIPGFAARLSDQTLDALRRNPGVAYVEQDQVVHINCVFDSPADGIDRMDQRTGHDGQYDDHGRSGAGVHIYIVDTGIRTTHDEFTGRVAPGSEHFTAINDGNGFQDCNGHGTHVASTAAGTQFGMAKQATVHAVRVLSCAGSGTTSGVISGVEFVHTECTGSGRACVANMSIGGNASTALDSAVANAVAAGIPFAVAIGNDDSLGCDGSLVREESAIIVGAIDDGDSVGGARGPCVDVFAPGASILGAGIGSDSSTQDLSGTSMASPHVAGAAAQILSANPGFSPADVQAAMTSSANLDCIAGNLMGAPNIMLHNDFSAGPFVCGDSCVGRCGGYDGSKPCQCDSACTTYGDCCSDIGYCS